VIAAQDIYHVNSYHAIVTGNPRVHDEGDRSGADPADPGGVEAYEDGGSVVLFDADNPLAWVETTETDAVRLSEAA